MTWIVTGPDKDNMYQFVSKGGTVGLLPKGSYLTITDGDKPEFVLRVEASSITYPYQPAPMIVDMNLEKLQPDLKWQNHISARVIKDVNERDDGHVNVVKVLSQARRSNQEEVQLAMGMDSDELQGPKVFLSTIHDNRNQILTDEDGKYLQTNIREDVFFHQIMVCGKTGSGKTVSTKYLAQYFVEKMGGAVLAINVKDVDFLKMDKVSDLIDDQIKAEWSSIGEEGHSVKNFTVYYPSISEIKLTKGVTPDITQPISLDVSTIEPEALNGILQSITDIAAQHLPDIFRFWRDEQIEKNQNYSYNEFVDWFSDINQREEERNNFSFKTIRGDVGNVRLAAGTASNILRNLNSTRIYFDDPHSTKLNAGHILQKGMMSVIDLEDEKAKTFGSVMLRHLLHQIVEMKSSNKSDIKVLIIIDEVHQFYNTSNSKEALGDLDTICRQGRSQEIGVIFSSQNPEDIPKGLSNVINTKIFFKSDASAAKYHGVHVSENEMQNLKKGYAVANIHEIPQLKMLKFPLAFAGVVKK